MTNAPEVRSFTFANGITVQHRLPSSWMQQKTIAQAARTLRDDVPLAPVFRNELTGVDERNTNDSAYQADMYYWNARVGALQLALLMVLAVTVDHGVRDAALAAAPDHNDEQSQLDALLTDLDLPADQSVVTLFASTPAWKHPTVRYLVLVASDSNDDELIRFRSALLGELDMEEAVQAAVDSFRGDVQGSEHLGVLSAT